MYVSGIDFGGGSSKATLLNEKGKVNATASCESPTFYGNNGKAERNPFDWYKSACNNIKSILHEGLLPYSMQVGLTGKTISPKVYVAFGISGALQHICAIERANIVIAVNNKKMKKFLMLIMV